MAVYSQRNTSRLTFTSWLHVQYSEGDQAALRLSAESRSPVLDEDDCH